MEVKETLLEAATDFSWPGGAVLAWNPEAESLLDWSRSEVLGRSFVETVVPPEQQTTLGEYLGALARLSSGSSRAGRIELTLIRRDGTRFPAEMVIRSTITGQGTVLSVTIGDVTDRKRDELVQVGQNRVFEMVAGGSFLPEILTSLIRIIEQRFSVRASVLLVDGDNKHLRFGSAPSLPEAFNKAVDGLEIGPCSGSCGTAAYRCETVVIEDIKTDPLWAGFRELGLQSGIRSCWSTPILAASGQVLGTLCMYYDEPRRPAPAEVDLMHTTAQLASIAIEKRRAMGELENRGKQVEHLNEMLAARDERIKALKEELDSLRAGRGK